MNELFALVAFVSGFNWRPRSRCLCRDGAERNVERGL